MGFGRCLCHFRAVIQMKSESMKTLGSRVSSFLPLSVKETLKVRTLGIVKIPLLFFLSPTVLELNDYRCVVKIPLTYRSKNHLGSMYFGALAVGADIAGGLMGWKISDEFGTKTKSKKKINLIFKDFQAEFLKRPEGDVHFTCEDGQAVRKLVEQIALTGERDEIPLSIIATVPSKLGTEPVAKFVLTMSMK
jgi:acyl-coenzyme A thioesterase PaaI-like protein